MEDTVETGFCWDEEGWRVGWLAEASICHLLCWAINLKQACEHRSRPPCWLELGRLIDSEEEEGRGRREEKGRERGCQSRIRTERSRARGGEREGEDGEKTGRQEGKREEEEGALPRCREHPSIPPPSAALPGAPVSSSRALGLVSSPSLSSAPGSREIAGAQAPPAPSLDSWLPTFE